MLGQALLPLLEARHTATGVDIQEFDITDPAVVLENIVALAPEAIIHAAAMTQVDLCEKEWERAHRVNGLGTRNVALAAQQLGAALLYVSTDFVFDGEKSAPYIESYPARPLSVYGASKLAGEQAVRDLVARHYIVRTSWLYGPAGPNFVEAILRAVEAGKPLRVVSDQIGSPTCTCDLAPALVKLVESGLLGTYHVTNSGACSWHEYACTILRLIGKPEIPVARLTAAEWAAPAPRPAFSTLHNFAWIQSGFEPLRPWQEALADYMRLREPTGGDQIRP